MIGRIRFANDSVRGNGAGGVGVLYPSRKREKARITFEKGDVGRRSRKALQQNGFSLNKDKVGDIAYEISGKDIVDGKYILAQKGKRNYFLVKIV